MESWLRKIGRKLSNGCQTFEWALAKHVFKADNISNHHLTPTHKHTHAHTHPSQEVLLIHIALTVFYNQMWTQVISLSYSTGVYKCTICVCMNTWRTETHKHKHTHTPPDNIIKSKCSGCRLQNAYFQMSWRRETPCFSTGNWSRSRGWLHVCMCVQHTCTHTHRTDIDITMQTDTVTRHEQNWTQLENDSKASRGRREGRKGWRRRGQITSAYIWRRDVRTSC